MRTAGCFLCFAGTHTQKYTAEGVCNNPRREILSERPWLDWWGYELVWSQARSITILRPRSRVSLILCKPHDSISTLWILKGARSTLAHTIADQRSRCVLLNQYARSNLHCPFPYLLPSVITQSELRRQYENCCGGAVGDGFPSKHQEGPNF
jgi:hypothetical protein